MTGRKPFEAFPKAYLTSRQTTRVSKLRIFEGGLANDNEEGKNTIINVRYNDFFI